MPPLFIHLRCKTEYSFTQSSLTVKELVTATKASLSPAVATTDDCNLFGALSFSSLAAKAGVQPIIGATLAVNVGAYLGPDISQDNLLLLCKSANGYRALSRLISAAHLTSQGPGSAEVALDDLVCDCEDLICVWGGVSSALVSHLRHSGARDNGPLERLLDRYRAAFETRLYMEIQRCGETWEADVEPQIIELAYDHAVPLVGTNDVRFLEAEHRERFDILSCVGLGQKEYDPNRVRLSGEQYLKTPQQMNSLFSDLPECIENTVEIARRCAFRVEERAPILPVFSLPDEITSEEQLRIEAYRGFEDRFRTVIERLGDSGAADVREKYIERLEFELDVITRMDFAGYFLIVSDFMKWAKDQKIPVGVRGSGATSIVAWCMYITNLDPLRFNLVFERFLNPERISLPDFDIDFCQERRGEVIAYVRQKYGADRVAQIISFGTLQAKAAVRDVGRVIGAPYPLVDKITKLIGGTETLTDAFDQEPAIQALVNSDALAERCFSIARQVEGRFRNASVHAAGLIISARPLVDILPLYKDPKSDIPVTQFNYKDAEKVGLVKFDFLGLRTLTIIAETASNVSTTKGITVDVNELSFEDESVYEMLSSGQVSGVFQLESAGMRDLLRKLQPQKIEHLIALISLYRPGPMDSIPEFISRANGSTPVIFDHPLLEPVLSETYGIITYQEDVMRIARDLGGYSLGEADLLRRAMGKKIKSEMDEHRARFRSGAAERGVSADVAERIFEKCAKFAGYGFNKGHAAAYAQVSYQTAYLRCFYPAEFYAACMSIDADRIDRLEMYVRELRQKGIAVRGPNINSSRGKFTVEVDNNGQECIRYGLEALRGIGTGPSTTIETARSESGAFASLDDFFLRTSGKVSKAVSQQLAKAGAFDALSEDRSMVLAEVDAHVREGRLRASELSNQQGVLFIDERLRPTTTQIVPAPPMKKLEWEREAIGFYLSGHPLDNARSFLAGGEYRSLSEFMALVEERGSYAMRVPCLIEKLDIRRSTKSGRRYAFAGISDASSTIEAILFSETLEKLEVDLGVDTLATCDIIGEKIDGGIRYTITSFCPIAETPASIQSITLRAPDTTVEATQLVKELKDQLSNRTGGDVSILIEVPISGSANIAIISLPDRYRIDPKILHTIEQCWESQIVFN